MTQQKTITEMVRDLRERANAYEKQFGFSDDPMIGVFVRSAANKMRYDADNLEAALKLELKGIAT